MRGIYSHLSGHYYLFALISIAAALTATGQTQLTNGVPAQDSLTSPTSAKTWSLSAKPGDHITLTVAKLSGGAGFNPQIQVTSPLGFPLGTASGNIAARLDLQADANGTYLVSVSDAQQTGFGNYQIQLGQIPEAFTVPSGDEGGSLTNGASHFGTLTAGDLDMWTLQAQAGDRIVLLLSKTAGGAGLSPLLELFGPDGAKIVSQNDVTAARIDAQATSTGTYTAVVSGLTPDQTGSYQLQLVQVPGTPTIPAGDEGGPLPDGTAQSGTIALGDFDPWTFNAAVGDHITLQLAKTGGGASFTPQLELFAPNGDRRGIGQGLNGVNLDVAIEMAGQYVALVSDASRIGSGTYTLQLNRVSAAPITRPLTNGTTLQVSLGGAGQTNSWQFLASIGDRVVIRVGKSGTGNFNPWLRLYSPNNILLGTSSTANGTEIAVTATNSGTFVATVSDGSITHNQTGDYRISMAKPGSAGSTGVLTNGLFVTGSISVGDLNVWTISANSGETLIARMGELVPNSSLTPELRLYGPDGQLLSQYFSSPAAAEVATRATNSGTFTLVAGDHTSSFTGSGTYRLKLVKTSGPIVTDPSDEGGVLTNALTQTGNIVIGDLDIWNFTAEEGQHIILRMGELVANSSLTPFLRLYGPDGAFLAQFLSSPVAAEVEISATTSGTFSVVASDFTAAYTGSGTYQIKLIKTGSPLTLGPNDSGGAMTNGTTQAGNVSIGGMEAWTFSATSGESLVVRMGKLLSGASLTPFLRLLGPDGSVLSQFFASPAAAEVATQATNSGVFTVVATDRTAAYSGSGRYRIKLAQTGTPIVVAANDEGGSLTNGWNYAGNIDVGDMDVWSVDAVSNQFIVVRMGKIISSATLTPSLRIYEPGGALIDQFFSSPVAAEVSARATNSGTFTVIATDRTAAYTGTGTYRLKLARTGRPLVIAANDEGGAMTGQTNYQGNLDVGGMAVWQFNACGGEPVSITVTKTPSTATLTPWVRLFNWDGNLLKSASGASTASINMTTPGSGTYTIVVADLTAAYTGSGGFNLAVNGLAAGLEVCPEGADTQFSYVTVTGADSLNGYTLLTTTNVDTPKAQWETIPASSYDIYDNLNYTNALTPPGTARRFFRWTTP